MSEWFGYEHTEWEVVGLAHFVDRRDAGLQLGERLLNQGRHDVVVLGLPRGGVIVAEQVAVVLGVRLDVIVVRKLGVPYQSEIAMGAVAEGNLAVLDDATLRRASVSAGDVKLVRDREEVELDIRIALYRRGRTRVDLHERSVVVVDDGVATGSTARVACVAARSLGATSIMVAVPVAPPGVFSLLDEADEVLSLITPTRFRAVSLYYDSFAPTTDQEVLAALDRADERLGTND